MRSWGPGFGATGSTAGTVALNAPVQASTGGTCDRTQQVQDAILAELPYVSDCTEVTDTELSWLVASITTTLAKCGLFLGSNRFAES